MSVLHMGDKVQEIATARHGKIDSINYQGTSENETPTMWRVYFSDSKEPLIQYFKKEEDLRLVECPHSKVEPGFVPERPIMQLHLAALVGFILLALYVVLSSSLSLVTSYLSLVTSRSSLPF